MAFVEILTKKTMNGTVRFFQGITVSALIGFGIDTSTNLFSSIFQLPKASLYEKFVCNHEFQVNPFWFPVLFVLANISFNMLANTHYKQLFPMIVISAIGTATFFSSSLFPTSVKFSAVLSAFTLGAGATIWSHVSGDPVIIGLIGGLYMLVPGGLAVKGFIMFFNNDSTSGFAFVTAVVQTALSLAVGIFASTLLLDGRETSEWFKHINAPWKYKSQLNFWT